MQKLDNKLVIHNTFMLYIMNFAKLIFPLLTFPYLTRILSVDYYGLVVYMRSIMIFMQVLVDFGFILSSTGAIVKSRGNLEKIGEIVGDTIFAKVFVCFIAFILLVVMIIKVPILNGNISYVLLSFATVGISCFLLDFLFRGIEKMEIITIIFVVMKGVSTALTFLLVKSDNDLLLLAGLDIISSILAVILTLYIVSKMNIKIKISNIKGIAFKLKESSMFFLSNAATLAFNSFTTFLIGIYMSLSQVALWGVGFQIIGAAQSLYGPIINGIYPYMIKHKNIKFIFKIFKIFIPIILVGCFFTFFFAKEIVSLISGEHYVPATPILRMLLPMLFISFPAMILGWPTLGSIDKARQITSTTVLAGLFQIIGLGLLIKLESFNFVNIAILRCLTELVLFISRATYCHIFRKEFNG